MSLERRMWIARLTGFATGVALVVSGTVLLHGEYTNEWMMACILVGGLAAVITVILWS